MGMHSGPQKLGQMSRKGVLERIVCAEDPSLGSRLQSHSI